MRLSRRAILNAGIGLAGASAFRPFAGRAGDLRFTNDPFTLGVASGYPEPNAVVLWTRLAPEPLLRGGGVPSEAVDVAWEIASDEQWQGYEECGDLDFAYGMEGVARFRANYLRQENGAAAVFRIIPEEIVPLEKLNLPKAIEGLAKSGAELLLYSVNAVTQGTESQGEVTVRLAKGGRIVNGVGADTDIVVASAKAYISALNKLASKVERLNPQHQL